MPGRILFRAALSFVFAAVALPTVVSAQGVPADRARLRTALSDIATLRTAYVDAFNQKDAKALAAFYTADGILIQPDGNLIQGREALAKAMADSAPQWPHAVIKSDTTRVYGSTAVDMGTWTEHPTGGGERVARYVTMLRRDMSGWKIAHVVVVAVK